MPTINQAFRKAFPAFMDPSCYPDHELNYWFTLGEKLLDKCRWGDLYSDGLYLFAAHNLALEFNSKKQALKGQQPGQVVGVLNSASVDKVSYSRDASAAMDPKNGHWNLTIYGLRYVRLVKMVGAGPVQVAPNPMGAGISALGWPGPMFGPWG